MHGLFNPDWKKLSHKWYNCHCIAKETDDHIYLINGGFTMHFYHHLWSKTICYRSWQPVKLYLHSHNWDSPYNWHVWFVLQNPIHFIFQEQYPIFILSFTLSSLSYHFSPCWSKITPLSSLRAETYSLGLRQLWHHISLAIVIGSGISMKLKSVALSSWGSQLALAFCLEPERMEGQEHYCGEPDTETIQKTKLKSGDQPSTSELF